MRRRSTGIELFGVSFLDVLSCALGGVLLLLLIVVNKRAEEAKAAHEQTEQLKRRMSTLIGLEGEMKNVVFVFDTSGSMRGNDFPGYKNLLKRWVGNLGIEKLEVLQFSDNSRGWARNVLGVPRLQNATAENRKAAVTFVDSFEAKGGTNALDAFKTALQYPQVDTVVFFSDGEPDAGTETIVKWLNDNNHDPNKIVINTIGMGNYFEEAHGRFLQRVAKDHNGVFIGR